MPIRSHSESRLRRRPVPESELVTANIRTADLNRKADRLPEATKSEELSQCFDDLLKTIQCKGMGLNY